jgi:hypothetical protein
LFPALALDLVLSQTTIKIVGSFCAGGRKALMNFLKKQTNQWICFKILHALHMRIGWLKIKQWLS